jgi:hypothetical protein
MLMRFLLNHWFIWKNAVRIRRLLAQESTLLQAWALIVPIFKTSGRVYAGRVGPSATMPFQAEILNKLASYRSSNALFAAHINDPNAIFAAYCLCAFKDILTGCSLEDINLPEDLFIRSERVLLVNAGFVLGLSLGKYAQMCLRPCEGQGSKSDPPGK